MHRYVYEVAVGIVWNRPIVTLMVSCLLGKGGSLRSLSNMVSLFSNKNYVDPGIITGLMMRRTGLNKFESKFINEFLDEACI